MTAPLLPPGPSPEAVERPIRERGRDDGFARVLDRADRGRRDIDIRNRRDADRHDADRRVRRFDQPTGDRRHIDRDEATVDRPRTTGRDGQDRVEAVDPDDRAVGRSDEAPTEGPEETGAVEATMETVPEVDATSVGEETAVADGEMRTEAVPAESSPAGAVLAESAPAESAPAESAPAGAVLAESAPAESAPAESAPAEDDLLVVLGWTNAIPAAEAAPTSATGSTATSGDAATTITATGLLGGVAVDPATDTEIDAAAVDASVAEQIAVDGDAGPAVAPTTVALSGPTTGVTDDAAAEVDTTERPDPATAGTESESTGTGADLTDGSADETPPPPPAPRALAEASDPSQVAAARGGAAQPNPGAEAAQAALDPTLPDVGTEPTAPVQAPTVAAPSSTGPVAGPSSMLPSGAVQRIMEVVEEIARQTPPRSMTVDLTELEGVRVQVALDGAGVRIRVLDDMTGDARRQLERELARSLAERGFDLSHDGGSERRPGADQRADRDAAYQPVSTGRVLRPSPASGPAPLSDQRGVRL